MSYEFTKLSEVPAVSEFPEGANAIIETNGEIKRCPSSNTPKPLTYDYMPAGYPSKSVQTTTLMEEQELAFEVNEYVGLATLPNPLEITVGQTYKIKWDGTEYECVGTYMNQDIALGNQSIDGEVADTGEPFLYVYLTKQHTGTFETLDTSASHTISVKTTEDTVTPMAEEFLPATALITYNTSTDTYSSDLTNDELHARLLGGKQIVLHKTVENEYFYLTKWAKVSSGRIDLGFEGDVYSVSLKTDGTIGKKPLS